MIIQYLDWDTNFFGIKTGKVELFDESEFDSLTFKQKSLEEKYELIYLFKYGKMLSWEKAITSNIELVDIILTMSMEFNKDRYVNLPYTLRNALSSKELDACYQIAEQISVVSRFYNELKVGPIKTKLLYRKWIDNAINKSFSDGIFLNKKTNNISGIHLIKTDTINKVGFFTLTGVDKKSKGKGIGTSLWRQSFAYWANIHDINIIKSSFSFQNKESFNFHLKNNFKRIEELKYIYHYRNSNIS